MHYITDAERTSPHYSLPSDASKVRGYRVVSAVFPVFQDRGEGGKG